MGACAAHVQRSVARLAAAALFRRCTLVGLVLMLYTMEWEFS